MSFFLDRDAVAEAARLLIALFQFCLFQPRPEGHRWAHTIADRLAGDEPYASEVFGAAALGSWFEGDTEAAVDQGLRAVAAAAATGTSDRWARTALVDALAYAGDLSAAAPHYAGAGRRLANECRSLLADQRAGLRGDQLRHVQPNGRGIAMRRALALANGAPARQPRRPALGALRAGPGRRPHPSPRGVRGVRAGDASRPGSRQPVQRRLGPRRVGGPEATPRRLANGGGGHARPSRPSRRFRQPLPALASAPGGRPAVDEGRPPGARRARPSRAPRPTAMPTEVGTRSDDSNDLSQLERRLGNEWPRLRIRAQALAEPELIGLCRDELARLQAGPSSAAPA